MLRKKGKKDPGNPTRASATKEMDSSRASPNLPGKKMRAITPTEDKTNHLRA
jgi:hypothetical protein